MGMQLDMAMVRLVHVFVCIYRPRPGVELLLAYFCLVIFVCSTTQKCAQPVPKGLPKRVPMSTRRPGYLEPSTSHLWVSR